MILRKGMVALLATLLTACASSEQSDPQIHEGHDLARQYGCVSCHTSDGSKSVAPTWKGLYRSRVELDDGTIVIANDAYLLESILEPSAKTVKGFEKGLMETVIKPNSIQAKDLKALLAYVKSLR